MPAAAVFPPPIVYFKVVAVKKLVVILGRSVVRLGRASLPLAICSSLQWSGKFVAFTVKILVFKAGSCLNTLAWNNRIGEMPAVAIGVVI